MGIICLLVVYLIISVKIIEYKLFSKFTNLKGGSLYCTRLFCHKKYNGQYRDPPLLKMDIIAILELISNYLGVGKVYQQDSGLVQLII